MELIRRRDQKYYLYPADIPPAREPDVHQPALDWVRRAYKNVGKWKRAEDGSPLKCPLECTQEPGDVLCIQIGWYRSSINCGESISVGGNVVGETDFVTSMSPGMELVQAGDYAGAAKAAARKSTVESQQ